MMALNLSYGYRRGVPVTRSLRTSIGANFSYGNPNLLESKLHTAGDLYTFMMDQFHASRGFVLEVMVVIILVIELAFVFHGK